MKGAAWEARQAWLARRKRHTRWWVIGLWTVCWGFGLWLAITAAPFVVYGVDTEARVVAVLGEYTTGGTSVTPDKKGLEVAVEYQVDGQTYTGTFKTREFRWQDGTRYTTVTYVRTNPEQYRSGAANHEQGAVAMLAGPPVLLLAYLLVARQVRRRADAAGRPVVFAPPPPAPAVPVPREVREFKARSRPLLTGVFALVGAIMLLVAVAAGLGDSTVALGIGTVLLAACPASSALLARARVGIDPDGIWVRNLHLAPARHARWEDVFYLDGVRPAGTPQLRMRALTHRGHRWVTVVPDSFPPGLPEAVAARLAAASPQLAAEVRQLRLPQGRPRTRVDEFMDRWGYLTAALMLTLGLLVIVLA